VIALIDYGAGNLTSVRKGFAAVGAELYTPATPDDVERARGIVVPGVGNFGATSALQGSWTEAIRTSVGRGVPLLGICLGLQWLFEGSDEAPDVPGLGAIAGTCSRLPQTSGLKVPHVGWNSLHVPQASRLLDGVAENAQVYFTHSYAAPVTSETAATCEHGTVFAAAIESGNIFGVQFHPEKSSEPGLRILRNFVAVTLEAVSKPSPGRLANERASEPTRAEWGSWGSGSKRVGE
jgi:imidazole glycerol-phosphate synthase subunit HisH